MAQLRGLTNTYPIRRAYLAKSTTKMLAGLRKGRAMTTADDYGALNAYQDRDGKYRCEAHCWMHTVDSQIFTSLTAAGKWWTVWVKKIAERPAAKGGR